MKKGLGTISRSEQSRAIFRKRKKREVLLLFLLVLFVAAGIVLLEFTSVLDFLVAI